MMYYNFGRKQMTLGMTPTVKAGIARHLWSVEESKFAGNARTGVTQINNTVLV